MTEIVHLIVILLKAVDDLYDLAQKMGHTKRDLTEAVEAARKERKAQIDKDRAAEIKEIEG